MGLSFFCTNKARSSFFAPGLCCLLVLCILALAPKSFGFEYRELPFSFSSSTLSLEYSVNIAGLPLGESSCAVVDDSSVQVTLFVRDEFGAEVYRETQQTTDFIWENVYLPIEGEYSVGGVINYVIEVPCNGISSQGEVLLEQKPLYRVAPAVLDIDIETSDYTYYYDYDGNIYAVGKENIILIHGDIITPIPLRSPSYLFSYMGETKQYLGPYLVQDIQNVLSGLTPMVMGVDYFEADFNGDGIKDLLFRGVTYGYSGLVYISASGLTPAETLAVDFNGLSENNFDISDRSVTLTLSDQNGDSRTDIVRETSNFDQVFLTSSKGLPGGAIQGSTLPDSDHTLISKSAEPLKATLTIQYPASYFETFESDIRVQYSIEGYDYDHLMITLNNEPPKHFNDVDGDFVLEDVPVGVNAVSVQLVDIDGNPLSYSQTRQFTFKKLGYNDYPVEFYYANENFIPRISLTKPPLPSNAPDDGSCSFTERGFSSSFLSLYGLDNNYSYGDTGGSVHPFGNNGILGQSVNLPVGLFSLRGQGAFKWEYSCSYSWDSGDYENSEEGSGGGSGSGGYIYEQAGSGGDRKIQTLPRGTSFDEEPGAFKLYYNWLGDIVAIRSSHEYPGAYQSIIYKYSTRRGIYQGPFYYDGSDTSNLIPIEKGIDYFRADFQGDGINEFWIRGAYKGRPALVISGTTSSIHTIRVRTSDNQLVDLSDRTIGINFIDQNGDGRADLLVEFVGPDEDQIYLTSGSGIPGGKTTSSDSVGASSTVSKNFIAGTSDGAFRVNEQGAATYSMPLNLPQGTAGVAPELSINYVSQGGSSLLGKGFNLSGITSVSRCRQTLAQDGKVAGISFSTDDRFCLNGVRLVPTVTNANYTEYRTEVESFNLIKSHGSDPSNPEYFEVWKKDGSITYFGRRTDARHVLENGKTLSWSISTFSDNMDNQINYYYQAEGNNDFRISKIKYAYGAGFAHNAEVEFFYEDRRDKSNGYQYGELLSVTKRLNKIVVRNAEIDSGHSMQEVRSYYLEYAYWRDFEMYQESFLEKVYECVGDTCLKPTEFQWNKEQGLDFSNTYVSEGLLEKQSDLLQSLPMDINGDGYLDFVWMSSDEHHHIYDHDIEFAIFNPATKKFEQKAFSGPIKNCTGNSNEPKQMEFCDSPAKFWESISMHAIDYNADGRQDLALYRDRQGNDEWLVFLSKPYNNSASDWRISTEGIVIEGIDREPFAMLLDTNSDGLQDILTFNNIYTLERDHTQPANSNVPYKHQHHQTLGDSKWIGMTEPFDKDESDYPPELYQINYTKDFIQAGDFNSDGKADVIVVHRQDVVERFVSNTGNTQQEIEWFGTESVHVQEHYYLMENKGDRFEKIFYFGETTSFGSEGSNRNYKPNTRLRYHARFVATDLNGDGYTDVVKQERKNSSVYYYLNTGNGFAQPSVAPMGLGFDHYNWQISDYNGDGYPDFIVHKYGNLTLSSKLTYRAWDPALNKFSSRELSIEGGPGSSSSKRYMFYDTSGDGHIDKILYSDRTLSVSINSHSKPKAVVHTIVNGLQAETNIEYEPLAVSDHYVPHSSPFISTNDSISFSDCAIPQESILPCLAGKNFDALAKPNFSSKFYSSLQNPFAEVQATEKLVSSSDKFPVMEYNTLMYVVTKVSGDAPAGDLTEPGKVYEGEINKSTIEYYYSKGLMQAAGRGFLGFRELLTLDKQSNIRTLTRYRQDWPFIGSPEATYTYLSDGQLISKQESEWGLQVIDKIGKPESQWTNRAWTSSWRTSYLSSSSRSIDFIPYAFRPYLKSSKEYSYALESEVQHGPTRVIGDELNVGGVLQTVEINNEYDPFGNALNVTTTTIGSDGMELVKHIENQYVGGTLYLNNGITASHAWLGRLTRTQTSTTRSDNSQTGTESTRTSTFSYYTSGDHAGMLHVETLEPGSDLYKTQTTNYYDSQGNKVKSQVAAKNQQYDVSGENIVSAKMQYRIEEIDYDSSYRYVNQTRTLFDHDDNSGTSPLVFAKEIVAERNELGLPTHVISGLDDTEVTNQYDEFGRLIYSDSNVSGSVTTSYLTCAQLSGEKACPPGAVYAVKESAETGSESISYVDVLGRTLRSGSLGFDGIYRFVDTEFDPSGRTLRSSEPHKYSQAPAHWSQNRYDILGRNILTELPSSADANVPAVQVMQYMGNKIITENALGHARIETKNGLGELIEIEDANGGRITYKYDDQGNLHRMISHAKPGDPIQIDLETVITYDDYGRKLSMSDPDKGDWEYKYNAFGELVWQRDAKQQVVIQSYDSLARMLRRTDYAPKASGDSADSFADAFDPQDQYKVEQHTRWYYDGETDTLPISYAGLSPSAVVMNNTNAHELCMDGASIQCSYPTYDNFGRAYETEVRQSVGGVLEHYTSHVQYHPELGYVKKQFDALSGIIKSAVGSSSTIQSGIENHYNEFGFLEHVTDLQTGDMVYRNLEQNDRGQITRARRGNGLTSVYEYDDATGQLVRQQAGLTIDNTAIGPDVNKVQHIDYKWDVLNNLLSRHNTSKSVGNYGLNTAQQTTFRNAKESFCYDELNRLVTVTSGSLTPNCSTEHHEYDSRSNMLRKSGTGDYVYQQSGTANGNGGPNALQKIISETGTEQHFYYDANGNLISDQGGPIGQRNFVYSTFDKPTLITKGAQYSPDHSTSFYYGVNRGRYLRVDRQSNGVTVTTQYIGNVEKIKRSDKPNEIEWKRYLGKSAIFTLTTNNNLELTKREERYVYNDHLGSLDVITDEYGFVVQSMSFDAWGQRRDANSWSPYSYSNWTSNSVHLAAFRSVTTRGYTGHEMVDELGIIHMNGRIYDPRLARFLQADPFIQAATFTQSLNRYAYVWNNPLNSVDPSGYWNRSVQRNFRQAVGIALVVVAAVACAPVGQSATCGSAAWAVMGMASAVAAMINGADGQGILRAALTGAVTSFVGGLDFGHWFAQAMVMGATGGITSILQGGKFGHGFASGAIGSAMGAMGEKFKVLQSSYMRVGMGAIAGGTVSSVTGGKFANGAITGAFSAAVRVGVSELNSESPAKPNQLSEAMRRQRAAKKIERLYETGTLSDENSFKSERGAAEHVLNAVADITADEGVEIGGWIKEFKNSEGETRFQYEKPAVGYDRTMRRDLVTLRPTNGAAAIYHTHPDGGGFSGFGGIQGDYQFHNEQGVNGYMMEVHDKSLWLLYPESAPHYFNSFSDRQMKTHRFVGQCVVNGLGGGFTPCSDVGL